MIEIATPGAGGEELAMGAPPGLPARLPILPLRDTVTVPDTLTPLAGLASGSSTVRMPSS